MMVSMQAKHVPLILIISLIAASIEMDISVPGFPEMARHFNTTEANIQATLGLNLFAFCLSSLFCGPLADSYGRKKVIMGGFILFGIGSICCALTNNLNWLLTYRFFQGLGASSLWVISYAVIADLYQGRAAAKYVNALNGTATAAMAFAPAAGSLLCEYYGWRATYTCTAVFSVASLLLLGFFLPETLKQTRLLNVRNITADYFKLLRDLDFMIFALTPSILSAGYMSYIASAPFLYIDKLGMSFNEYALHQTFVIATFSIVSFKSDWLMEKFGEIHVQKIGLVLSILSVLIMSPLAYLFPTSAVAITASMTAFSIGVAICFGTVVAKTLEFFPELKGTASALMMSIRCLFCSLGVWIGSQFYSGNLFDTALTIAVLSAIGVIFNILTFRHNSRENIAIA